VGDSSAASGDFFVFGLPVTTDPAL